MKTLSHLQNEAIERLTDLKCVNGAMYFGSYDNPCDCGDAGCVNQATWEANLKELKTFLKTELETIVKESFKNTRVEEKEMRCLECADSAECECRNNNFSYRLAISDKHNKENTFLGE